MIRQIIFWSLLALPVSAKEIKYIRLLGFDPVLEEQVKEQIKSKMRWQFNYRFVKSLDKTGGTIIIYTDDFPKCFNTVFGAMYNQQMERLPLNQIVINSTCVDRYAGTNKIYAFFNSINHEYFCHAVGNIKDHPMPNGKPNLCNEQLSTAKFYFTDYDRNWIKQNL